jgi:hypothetical protein
MPWAAGGRHMSRLLTVSCAFFITGCASAQLNFNTLDIASSVSDLYTKQVLINLSRIIDDRDALPSQLDITGGVVQTNFSVTPNVSSPLSRSITRTAAGVISGSATAGASASLNISDSSQQNWSVAPVSESNSLRNLRALYRYAAYGGNLSDYTPSFTIDSKQQRVNDPFFTSLPHCVKCAIEGNKSLVKNPKLGPGKWLYWTTDLGVSVPERLPPPGEAVIELGHYGNHTLMILQRDREYLSEFVLFTMPVNEPDGGAKGDKKGSPRTPKRGPFFVPPAAPLANPPS